MIEETACNEEAALIEGGLPGVTGAGVTAADARADAAADAPAENVSRETFAPEQGKCMSRQRASLEVPVDMISIARTAQIEGAGLKLVAPAIAVITDTTMYRPSFMPWRFTIFCT